MSVVSGSVCTLRVGMAGDKYYDGVCVRSLGRGINQERIGCHEWCYTKSSTMGVSRVGVCVFPKRPHGSMLCVGVCVCE